MKSRSFPAEWEEQQGVLLSFPANGQDWPGKYQAVQWAFVEFIRKVAYGQMVYLLVADEKLRERVAAMLERAHVNMERVSFIIQPTNRNWMRDSGPVLVRKDSGREALNFHFNGWAKYPNYSLDRLVPGKMAAELDLPLIPVRYKGKPVVLEGGAIDSNGLGTLLTSEECLLHKDIQVRNPGLDREDYERIFEEYLGIQQVIWLGEGISGDDTHGHIDDLCRFVNEDTVVTVIEKDPHDPNYRALKDNRERLKQARLQNGKAPLVVELPMPDPIVFEGVRLPASYANFLILNHCVLMPTFNDVNDRLALQLLEACFPGREVIGISAIDLIWGFGTLHCLSQQIPL